MSNRKEMLAAAERAILERRPGTLVGMLHVHVRRLRQISIALDHDIADAVPGAAEERLRAFLRSADLVARIGEQDFMVVLPNLLSPGHAELADLCPGSPLLALHRVPVSRNSTDST